MKKIDLWSAGFAALLAAFTVYIALDTFVLSSVYQTDATEMNTSMFSPAPETAAPDAGGGSPGRSSTSGKGSTSNKGSSSGGGADTGGAEATPSAPPASVGDFSYEDQNISITITSYYENDTRTYVADILLTSPEYLKTAFAKDTYGKNVVQTTSRIASDHGAILAINGDYYGAQEAGYVIRNGVVYRDRAGTSDVLCIYADGHLEVIAPRAKTAEALVEEGVWQAFSFGPALVTDGAVAVSENDEVGKSRASNPRTAIGILGDRHYVFVVSDGRTGESRGLSLYQLAVFLQKLGAVTAYNLDGGGSSTMYFNGQVINNPTTNGKTIRQREVSDIVYIG